MALDILISNTKNVNNGATPQTDGNKTSSGNTSTAATKDSKVKQTATSVYVHQIISTSSSIAKQTARYAISQYGDLTGDYIGQRKIDRTLDVASGLASIGSSAIMGGISGGWIGAIVGAGLTTIQMGVSYLQGDYETSKKIAVTNAQANYNAQRIGSILVDGNRG